MNVGIVVLKEGTPCVVCDRAVPWPLEHLLFRYEDYSLSFVGRDDENEDLQIMTLDFPLDHSFVHLLEDTKEAAVTFVPDGTFEDIEIYPVLFEG